MPKVITFLKKILPSSILFELILKLQHWFEKDPFEKLKTMDFTQIRKLSLKAFLGFLGLTALIAIVSVLSDSFGEFQTKILATSFTISAASICSMSCAAFIEKKKREGLGLSGIFFSIVAAILLIVGIWSDIKSDEYWKIMITFGIAAVAFAHAFLLLLPKLDNRQKWVQWVSSACIGILALLIVVLLWTELDNEAYNRLLAVVAIIVGLETLAIPILIKLRKGDEPYPQKLILEKLEGDLYKDAAGKKYQLKEIKPEQNEKT